MVIPILLFVFGLAFLIKGGDLFVVGATGIAKRFHIPEMLIGATVVSIETTLPEVMVPATSALGGHGEIAYGNAIGSIICNTALVAAVTIAIRPTKKLRANRLSCRLYSSLPRRRYILLLLMASGSFQDGVAWCFF